MNRNILISFAVTLIFCSSVINLQAQKTPYQQRVDQIVEQTYKKMGTTKEQLVLNMLSKASAEDGLAAIFEIAIMKDECMYMAAKVEKYCNTIVFNKAEICEWYHREMKKAENLKTPAEHAEEQKKPEAKKKEQEAKKRRLEQEKVEQRIAAEQIEEAEAEAKRLAKERAIRERELEKEAAEKAKELAIQAAERERSQNKKLNVILENLNKTLKLNLCLINGYYVNAKDEFNYEINHNHAIIKLLND